MSSTTRPEGEFSIAVGVIDKIASLPPIYDDDSSSGYYSCHSFDSDILLPPFLEDFYIQDFDLVSLNDCYSWLVAPLAHNKYHGVDIDNYHTNGFGVQYNLDFDEHIVYWNT